MTDDALPHRPDCAEPVAVATMGRRGDPMLRCTSCRAFRLLTGDEEHELPEPLQSEPPPPRVIACAGGCGAMMAHPSPRAAVRYCGACARDRRTAEARRARRDARRRQAQSEPWGWIQ